MRITNNLTAKDTYTQYSNNNVKIGKATQKLSSGSAINSAADNAAGLAISEKMRAQIRGLDKASANAQDAISLVQTAEGSLDESTSILQKMRQLAVQSASDTNESEIDREALQAEFEQLQDELDDIAKNTTFNKKNLLDGSLAATSKNVNVTKLANAKTAVSVGNAAVGNYSFSVSTKLETAAVEGKIASANASKGTVASATLSDTPTVVMNSPDEKTALYNGNYTLSSKVDSASGSITVTAKGDNGQNFSTTLNKADMQDTSLELNFKTADNANDAFTLKLDLKSAIDPDSENALNTLASAIDDVTVSIDGGVDAKDATYGVYANCTGASSVKLNAGDNAVTFDNGVTVSFDSLTATDVAVDFNSSVVLSSAAIPDAETNGTEGDAATVVLSNLTTTLTNLKNGDEFVISVNGNDYKGTYKGETGNALDELLKTTLDGSASKISQAQAGPEYAMEMTVSNGVVTYTSGDNAAANAVGSNVFTINTPATPVALTYTASNVTSAATYKNSAAITDASWNSPSSGEKVYVQIGEQVIEGTYDTDVNTTLAKMLSGTSFTDSNGESFSFTGVNAGVYTYTGSGGLSTGYTADTNLKAAAGGFAKGNAAVLSDGLVKKLGTDADINLASTTATTFTVEATKNDGLTFQVGANEGDEMTIHIEEMNCKSLGVNSAKVSTREGASAAISAVDDALNQVSSQRAYLGAIQNRLDHKIANLDTSGQNLTAAESQIRDVDMAKEMTEFTNAGILQQASVSMLAQANSQPQSVLSLLG